MNFVIVDVGAFRGLSEIIDGVLQVRLSRPLSKLWRSSFGTVHMLKISLESAILSCAYFCGSQILILELLVCVGTMRSLNYVNYWSD